MEHKENDLRNSNEIIDASPGGKFAWIIPVFFLAAVIVLVYFILKMNPENTIVEMEIPPTFEELASKPGVIITEGENGSYIVTDKYGTTTIFNPDIEDPANFEVCRKLYSIERSVNKYLPTGFSVLYHEDSKENSLQNNQIVTQMFFSNDVFDLSHFDSIKGISDSTYFEGGYINYLIEMNEPKQAEEFVNKIKSHTNPSTWTWRGDYEFYKDVVGKDVSIVQQEQYIYIVYVSDELMTKKGFPSQEELMDSFFYILNL